jgi:hypothetical protein
MYLDFLYVPVDYFSTLKRKECTFELLIPFLISIGSLCYSVFIDVNSQYHFIQSVLQFMETLLGFTLAALTLLLSNSHIEEKTKKYQTHRQKRGKPITMYELLVVQFSHPIVIEAILCATYYCASLFSAIYCEIGAMIVNTLFIFMTFHVMFATIRAVSCIYFIATGLNK